MRSWKSLFVSLFLVLPVVAFANEPVSTNAATPEIQTWMDTSGETTGTTREGAGTEKGSNASSYTCTAWTQCYNGRQIGCQATGYACRSDAAAGSWVACQAWGSDGSYSRADDSCY